MLLTRSPLIQPNKSQVFSVRLACVKHAASVRPEPGSNSPNKTVKTISPENPPQKRGKQSQPKKYSKTKNRHKNKKQTHYRVHKQHPHTPQPNPPKPAGKAKKEGHHRGHKAAATKEKSTHPTPTTSNQNHVNQHTKGCDSTISEWSASKHSLKNG